MRTIIRILRSRITRQVATVVAVLLALLLRVTLAEQSISLPTYVTFYPVVFLAALLGGMWTGILATGLSALLADYFLLEPVGKFAIHSTSDIVGMVIFCVSGVTVSVVAEVYHRSRERRAAYGIEAAVVNERGKVEEAGGLAETVREERLRFLGVLESLRRMNNSTVSFEAVPIDGKLHGEEHESWLSTVDQARFRASLRWTIALPFIAALILAGAALWAAYNLNASLQWVDHTDQVMAQSRRLLRLTVDMESGERGYLITGNDAFLQPYQEASKAVDSEYQALYLMDADNPSQQSRLRKVRENLDRWQGYAEKMIALRRAGGLYADLDTNLAGKAKVDEIRDQLAEFQGVEVHLRDERNRTAHRDWRLVATICILLGLGVGTGLAIFTLRRMDAIAASFEKSGRALERSERRWVTTLASIGDAVMATDRDGRVTFLNPVAAALTGWRAEDALGQPVQRVFHIINEQTRIPAEDIVNRVLTEGRTFELANHTALLARDGREIPIADSAAPIHESDGAVAGVVLVFSDITERRRAEVAVRDSQAKLQAALASMTDSVIITDAEGRFVEFNDAYARFYRFKSKAECARNFDEFTRLFDVFLPSGEPAPRETYAIQRALRGETATNQEYRLQSKDTGEYWIGSISFSPIRDKDGTIAGTVITSRDITEAKRAEEERQIAVDFLAMMNQSHGSKDLLQRAADFFQERSGCEAAGIRLREGEDYPYFEARGFSEEFVEAESRLCAHGASGEVMRDKNGKAILECLCGSVIRGDCEPSKPFYTSRGSFWSNSTSKLMASAGNGDFPSNARHRCNREGYESVALFPMYVGEERFGLVQLNDRRKGRFSAQEIVLWERMAGHLATAVSKFQAEEALRSSQEQLQAIIDGAADTVVFLKDIEGRFISVNSRFEELLGITRDDVRGKTDYDIITRERADHYRAHDQQVLETGQPMQIEEVARLADGKEHTFLANKFPLVDTSGKPYAVCSISVDITERKQAEQALIRSEKMAFEHKQLQALAERLRQVREEERKMVARDLHDDIGQILTAIKMDMTWAVRQLPKSEDEVHGRLAGSIELINEGVQSVRRICSGLRPGILDDLGLAAAIDWQAKEFASRTGIPCQVTVPPGELRLDGDRATAVFRIFQECLTNVARHAEAHSVRNSLDQQDESLILVVEDDGKGFLESEVAGSLGVLGMKERAQVFGGSVQVSSSPGKGTKITVRIPLGVASAGRKDNEHSDS